MMMYSAMLDVSYKCCTARIPFMITAQAYQDVSTTEITFSSTSSYRLSRYRFPTLSPTPFLSAPKTQTCPIQDLLVCRCIHYIWTQPFTTSHKGTLFYKVILVRASCHCITWLFFLHLFGLSWIQSGMAVVCLGLCDLHLSCSI